MNTAPKYKPGDRVADTGYGLRFGEVARNERGRIYVRWDGHDNAERAISLRLRLETADDVARRQHESAMRTWRASQPRTEFARPLPSMRWGDNSILGVTVGNARTPVEMRQAAAELHALADWFDSKPQGYP